jgi:hypothetical protein
MKAPPRDQKHESADDSENDSLRHFFTHLARMPGRLQFVTVETVIRLQECIVCAPEGVWVGTAASLTNQTPDPDRKLRLRQ